MRWRTFTALGFSCTLILASVVWADGMPGGMPIPAGPVEPAESAPAAPSAYDQAMAIGYAATEQKDYQTALINFRRALEARPNDPYARTAIANVQTYIAQQRAEEAKRQERVQLQGRLQRAVEATDWACALATVDRLIMLVPPDSNDRTRLLAYRSDLGGYVSARANLEQWSTVCPGTLQL